MKNKVICTLLLLISACDSGVPEEKIYFQGIVEKTLNIPGKDKIQSVKVKLNSGNYVTVFVEQNHKINQGEKVKVFKYKDNVSHYLVK